jgi:hypothetical protein
MVCGANVYAMSVGYARATLFHRSFLSWPWNCSTHYSIGPSSATCSCRCARCPSALEFLYANDLVVFLTPNEAGVRLARAIMDFFADASGAAHQHFQVPVHAHPVLGGAGRACTTMVSLPGDPVPILLSRGSSLHSQAQKG